MVQDKSCTCTMTFLPWIQGFKKFKWCRIHLPPAPLLFYRESRPLGNLKWCRINPAPAPWLFYCESKPLGILKWCRINPAPAPWLFYLDSKALTKDSNGAGFILHLHHNFFTVNLSLWPIIQMVQDSSCTCTMTFLPWIKAFGKFEMVQDKSCTCTITFWPWTQAFGKFQMVQDSWCRCRIYPAPFQNS